MDPQQQMVSTLKNIESLLAHQRSIENLLENVVVTLESIRESNKRIEETMGQAWKSYDQLEQQNKKVRKV